MTDDIWETARRENIAKMVATEPRTIWADGHKLMTCGGHTGHTVQAIAYCADATWAEAIANAINARPEETSAVMAEPYFVPPRMKLGKQE